MPRVVIHALALLLVWLATTSDAVAVPSRHVAEQRPEPPPAIKVLPRDDSASDLSFLAFKRRLLSAAKRGDIAVLRASMAPTLNAGFEPATPEQVIASRQLREGEPWTDLVAALELGVAREPERHGLFIAPYLSATSAELLPFDDLAVIGRDVRLRASPAADAHSVASMSYDVVRRLSDYPYRDPNEAWSVLNPRHWVQVLTSAGTTGYVFGRFVRAGADMRYYFEKVNGRWLMTMLAGGD
jgi:hypothetical protein